MKQFEANNGNIWICNHEEYISISIKKIKDFDNRLQDIRMKMSLEDMIFIRNCFDTIIKQELNKKDVLKLMIDDAVYDAMVKMKCKIILK